MALEVEHATAVRVNLHPSSRRLQLARSRRGRYSPERNANLDLSAEQLEQNDHAFIIISTFEQPGDVQKWALNEPHPVAPAEHATAVKRDETSAILAGPDFLDYLCRNNDRSLPRAKQESELPPWSTRLANDLAQGQGERTGNGGIRAFRPSRVAARGTVEPCSVVSTPRILGALDASRPFFQLLRAYGQDTTVSRPLASLFVFPPRDFRALMATTEVYRQSQLSIRSYLGNVISPIGPNSQYIPPDIPPRLQGNESRLTRRGFENGAEGHCHVWTPPVLQGEN